jgi:hypothetical protein
MPASERRSERPCAQPKVAVRTQTSCAAGGSSRDVGSTGSSPDATSATRQSAHSLTVGRYSSPHSGHMRIAVA